MYYTPLSHEKPIFSDIPNFFVLHAYYSLLQTGVHSHLSLTSCLSHSQSFCEGNSLNWWWMQIHLKLTLTQIHSAPVKQKKLWLKMMQTSNPEITVFLFSSFSSVHFLKSLKLFVYVLYSEYWDIFTYVSIYLCKRWE